MKREKGIGENLSLAGDKVYETSIKEISTKVFFGND